MKRFLLASVLTSLFVALPAYAQFDPLVYGTNLSISLSPQYPRPGDTVRLTAQATGIDLDASALVWHANGKVIAQGVGATTASVVAGNLGSNTDVEVDVATPDGSVRSAQAVIAPTSIELLISSDSYTPPFYKGRALPSAGTSLIVQALTHFTRTNGASVPDANITYTWKYGGEVLGSLSGRGRSSASIPIRHLFGNDAVTVTAVSSDGTLSGETSAVVPTVDPALALYEDHPLYGILFNAALHDTNTIPESEMAFAAIPYFAQVFSQNDPALSYVWRVNGAPVAAGTQSPSELTINADNSSGQALIALEVTHAKNFYMDAAGTWAISFSKISSQADQFHPSTQ